MNPEEDMQRTFDRLRRAPYEQIEAQWNFTGVPLSTSGAVSLYGYIVNNMTNLKYEGSGWTKELFLRELRSRYGI